MIQKQIYQHPNISNKTDRCNIRINNNKESRAGSKRPVLYSSEDVEQMAVESSRARLMMQLLSEPEDSLEKTTPCFHDKSNAESIYTTKCHTTKIPASKRNFATYPTLVHGLRWSPSIETYSEDSQTDTSCEDRKFKCKFHSCGINDCLGQKYDKNVNNYSFKDNIVKFSDISTMTRNLMDSACGARTPISTANNSEVSISTSDVTVKNVLRIETPQEYPINPAPILKKPDYESKHNYNSGEEIKKRVSANLDDDVNNKMCSDYENLLKTFTKQAMVTTLVNKNDYNKDSRKVLYNEGISSSIANNVLPNNALRTKEIQSQMKFHKSNKPQRSNKRLSGKQTVIPYTHLSNSKYHYDCKKRNNFYIGKSQEDLNCFSISPIPNISEKQSYLPSIRLPRRVLTSEKNIEAFVDKRPTKMSSAFKNKN